MGSRCIRGLNLNPRWPVELDKEEGCHGFTCWGGYGGLTGPQPGTLLAVETSEPRAPLPPDVPWTNWGQGR